MASYSAIADVGETLIDLLRDRTTEAIDNNDIVLASPGAEGAGDDFRLTVYLYDVTENEHLSNDRARPESTGRPAGAALVLDLHYLLTAHPKKQQPNIKPTRKSTDQHEVLGRAMQILANNSLVREPDLHDGIEDESPIAITVDPTERRDLVDIWGTFGDVGYEPSVPFVVSPIVIDGPERAGQPRVLEAEFREFDYRSMEEGSS